VIRVPYLAVDVIECELVVVEPAWVGVALDGRGLVGVLAGVLATTQLHLKERGGGGGGGGG